MKACESFGGEEKRKSKSFNLVIHTFFSFQSTELHVAFLYYYYIKGHMSDV